MSQRKRERERDHTEQKEICRERSIYKYLTYIRAVVDIVTGVYFHTLIKWVMLKEQQNK